MKKIILITILIIIITFFSPKFENKSINMNNILQHKWDNFNIGCDFIKESEPKQDYVLLNNSFLVDDLPVFRTMNFNRINNYMELYNISDILNKPIICLKLITQDKHLYPNSNMCKSAYSSFKEYTVYAEEYVCCVDNFCASQFKYVNINYVCTCWESNK
jgi:hypothetical protein